MINKRETSKSKNKSTYNTMAYLANECCDNFPSLTSCDGLRSDAICLVRPSTLVSVREDDDVCDLTGDPVARPPVAIALSVALAAAALGNDEVLDAGVKNAATVGSDSEPLFFAL